MSKISKKFAAILIIVICLGAVYGTKFFIGLSKKGLIADATAKVKGSNGAPIKVVEFIDFQCPACAGGAKYLKQMMKKYPGAIHLELKHFPLKMHRHGFLSSQYAECAARQEKFWLFHDSLLARQGNWKRLADARPAFDRIASEIDLNEQELESCLQGEAAGKAIEKDKAEGQALKIQSTPTYFVNGKMVVGKKSLDLKIKELLKENGY